MLNNLNAAPKAPCACCGAASETSVWADRVCYPCHAAWMADERFSSGVINAAIGSSDAVEQWTPESHARYCAEATRRTKAWVAERRQKARAA